MQKYLLFDNIKNFIKIVKIVLFVDVKYYILVIIKRNNTTSYYFQ